MKNFCACSLQRLGVDVIDLYEPALVDPGVPVEDTIGAVADLIEGGKVRHLGMSEYNAAQLRGAHAVHQEMVDWYRKVIGVTVIFQDANNAWTTNDAANHRIVFLMVSELSDDPEKVRHNGLHHTAFEYDSFRRPDGLVRADEGGGDHARLSLHHGLTISIYYRDPEGNHVELQSDALGDWAKSTEWMRTSEDFRGNPIGTFFDPQKVLEAHRGGMSFEKLSPAMRQGEFVPGVIPNIGLPEPDLVARGL